MTRAPCTDLCTGICQTKIIPALVWLFLPVQFQWQPLTITNLKPQTSGSKLAKKLNREKLLLLGIKSYHKPPNINFTRAFLPFFFSSIDLPWSAMRVNQQCWDFLLCSRVTLCTNTYWFELQTLLLWVGIASFKEKLWQKGTPKNVTL